MVPSSGAYSSADSNSLHNVPTSHSACSPGAAFRHSVLAEMPLGPGTRLTIRVKAPEEEHTVTVGKVLSWLEGGATSPSEQLKKKRLRERLRE